MKIRIYIICFMACAGLITCRESYVPHPLTPGVKPAKVTNTSIANYAGAATIFYQIPDKENTLYVMAEYKLNNGKTVQVKASRYVDSLKVEGFAKADTYEVNLYAVGSGEQRSDAVTVQVNPLIPPYVQAFDSLKIEPAFGGVSVSCVNMSAGNLAITAMIKDSTGKWVILDTHFSSAKNIEYSIYNMKSEETSLEFYIRDRWHNFSDTLTVTLTPYQEDMIDMSGFHLLILPGDIGQGGSGNWQMNRLFDGIIGYPDFFTPIGSGIPQHFTVDLNGVYRLSRIKFWQRQVDAADVYASANVKRFRIWGSMAPNPNGDFDSTWTLLGTFEDIKPSGLPLGVTSTDDITKAASGENFSFETATIPVHYIRFETLETWGSINNIMMDELQFYGSKP